MQTANSELPSRTTLDRKDLFVLAGFLLFLLVYFSGALIQPGEVCLGRPDGDAPSQFYGWRAYGFSEVRAGRFPLWNPHEFMGMPFVATLQSAMFYPTNWLCALGPLGRAINLGIILNLFLSGLFTYLWCRRLGIGRTGGVIAAGTYLFGAPQFMRIYEGHWSFLCAMPWIPCILFCIEVMLSGPRLRLIAMAAGGAAVAMQLFAGNPQYAFYGGIAALLYFAVRVAQERASDGGKTLFRTVGCFVGMYALGILLSGVQLLPALEMLAVSARKGQLSYQWVAQYSFVPENVLTLFSPDFFGSDISIEYWGRWNLWEMSAYVGVVAAGLAVVAILRGNRRLVIPACGIGAILLLLAFGRHTPLLQFLYNMVPGFDLFRVPARFLCPFSLFLALLAGLGADAVLTADRNGREDMRGRSRLRKAAWVIACLGVLFAVVGVTLTSDWTPIGEAWTRFMEGMLRVGPGERLYLPKGIVTSAFISKAMQQAGVSLLRTAMFLCALAGLIAIAMRLRLKPAVVGLVLIALVAADAWDFGRRYLKTFHPRTSGLTPEAIARLRHVDEPFRFARGGDYTFPPCEGMTYGFACLEGVQPNVPARFRDVFWSIQGFEKTRQRTLYWIARTSPFRMFNLRYLVQYRTNQRTLMPGLKTIHEDNRIRIDELPNAWPRAWLVHRYAVVPDSDKMLALLTKFNYEKQALFEEQPGFPVAEPQEAEAQPHVLNYEPSRVVIEAEPAADAFLILSDLHYPGWQATMDGKATPILRANYLMRAVHVPAGRHVIEFRYEPRSFKLGMGASLAGCAVAVFLILIRIRAMKRTEPADG